MIFITTSNGVYQLHEETGTAVLVMGNKHTPGLFKKKAKGYFGICLHQPSGDILVASREKLGTPEAGKPATDCKLHRINPTTLEHAVIAELRDLHDVHQIACHGDRVYLTDTGKNRVHVYDLNAGKVVRMINVGPRREDIHHLNALHCEERTLLIGLNNRGDQDSAILELPYDVIDSTDGTELDGLECGKLHTLHGIHHTHDIEPLENDYLICASHSGFVFRISDKEKLIHMDNWVRGLCCDDDGIWVGTSPLASRAERHSEKLDSSINYYSRSDMSLRKSIHLHGSGQVNDLITVA